MLLRPASPVSTTVAKISCDENSVSVAFPEIASKFNALVKRLGYEWNRPYWTRRLIARNGAAQDRAVELGHTLLLAGFCVQFEDDAMAQRAASGEYEPEQTRWISRYTSGKYQDWFCISWARSEDFYAHAKRLHGARYNPPHIAVPSETFEEVLDFAEAHDFRMTPSAQALANEARARWETAVIVAPQPKARAPKTETPGAIGISDELKDEPF